jgi:flagellar hook protein FlgE
MFNAFSIALSALSADSSAINVVGNNLANLNTNGFKSSEVVFHDLISQSLGIAGDSAQMGMGVGQIDTFQNFTQGAIRNTNAPLDAAIEGNGFFVVKDQNNTQLYTRAGNFQVDTDGNLVTATGENVQGWTAVNGTVNPNGPIGNITIPVGATIPATATTTMSIDMNLDSRVAEGDAAATVTAPIQVIDAQGASHTLTATFTKTDANKWSYEVTIPASDLTSGGTTSLATGTLTFDGTGTLTDPAATDDPTALKITGLANGAADLSVNWNLYDSSGTPTITQFAQSSGVSALNQNGAATGQITKIAFADGGLIVANYSNGEQLTVAQLAMAAVENPQSLASVGNNNLEATPFTAAPAIGAAGSGGRGQVVAGAVESSTSDMATEFTNLLTFERSYQAASRVITTSDQLMQETVNLIHP